MLILGINAYHAGASACIIRDGQLVAAVEEERFNRMKYWAGFPRQAIKWCLEEAGVDPRELDHIGISRNPHANMIKKALFTLRSRPSFDLIKDRLRNAASVGDLKETFASEMGVAASGLKAQFHHVEHHRAHMASAFYVSGFDNAAILSIDGMGDFVSTMLGVGSGTEMKVLDEVNFPHSLGYFYTAVCQWLGFTKYGDEGKVMGLAPYGEPIQQVEMERIVRSDASGRFELNLDYFNVITNGSLMTWDDGSPTLGTMYTPALEDLLGPARDPQSPLTKQHENVAASLQATLERIELALVKDLYEMTGETNLCMAGGVALNSAFNGKILPNTGFNEIFIQPAAGDAGTSLGVAYYIHHQLLGEPRGFTMTDAYTGPSFTDDEIASALDAAGLAATRLDDDERARTVAELVAAGKIVGLFQGKMEWGPRALGNRSILADPRKAETKDVLNARIKRREPFRPFAPSVLEERTADYFDQSYPDPFMLKVYGVHPERQEAIPAVTHVDGTGRLQTVSEHVNAQYHRTIQAFDGEAGVPVILNTSFNENEPIVCTPQEAIDCFMRTRMDALAVGPFVLADRG